MTMRKIDAMYHYYGVGVGRCGNCPHFVRKVWDKIYYKCTVYGDSNSEKTDWRTGYTACGLIDKPFPDGDVRIVRMIVASKEREEIKGQISLFDVAAEPPKKEKYESDV